MRSKTLLVSTLGLSVTGCLSGVVTDDKTNTAVNGAKVTARTCPTCSDQVTTTALYRDTYDGAFAFDPYPEGNGLYALPSEGSETTRFVISKSGYKNLTFYTRPVLDTYLNEDEVERLGQYMGQFFLTKTADWRDADGDYLSDLWEQRIGTRTDSKDTDGDGIDDGAEVLGADWIDYRSYGADPLHRDVFIEVDYEEWTDAAGTHTARLTAEGERKLLNLFANLDITNPDGEKGIRLHLVYDDVLPFPANCADEYQTTDDFTPARRDGFHYARICVKDTPGQAGQANGQRFYISSTEVNRNAGDDATEAAAFYQYALFAHELGHSLGLGHGGDDGTNCKPNYPSLMNYSYDYEMWNSAPSLRDTNIRFSAGRLPRIDENRVSEASWGPNGFDISFLPFYDGPGYEVGEDGRSVDWDLDGTIEENTYARIVRTDPACSASTTFRVLSDFNDAALIREKMAAFIPGAERNGNAGTDDPPQAVPQTRYELAARDRMRADKVRTKIERLRARGFQVHEHHSCYED